MPHPVHVPAFCVHGFFVQQDIVVILDHRINHMVEYCHHFDWMAVLFLRITGDNVYHALAQPVPVLVGFLLDDMLVPKPHMGYFGIIGLAQVKVCLLYTSRCV